MDTTESTDSTMIVYREMKSDYLTQGFGDNIPYCRTDINGNPIRPFIIKSYIPKGEEQFWTKFYPVLGLKGHNGFDRKTWHGEPLYFNVDCPDAGGWYSKNASDLDGGLGVDVISKNKVTLNGRTEHLKFRYWHLKEGYELGDVKLGQLIGLADNTGASSGDHCHDCMKRCNATGISLDVDNGYYGAVDYSQWFENTFVLDEIKRRNLVEQTEIKIVEAQLSLIDRLRQLISLLKIQIDKLSTPSK